MRRWEWYFPATRASRGTNFPDKNNFAPRFGFASDPTGSGKTSLRGGIGIFYDILKGEDNLQFNGQPPFVSNASSRDPNAMEAAAREPAHHNGQSFNDDPVGRGSPTPFLRSRRTDVDFTPFLPINSTGFVYLDDPHLRTPYVYQYNLSLQRNLIADTILEANYVGKFGTWLDLAERHQSHGAGKYQPTTGQHLSAAICGHRMLRPAARISKHLQRKL